MRTSAIENEVDLQLCMRRLWRGKGWILGTAVAAILLAWLYTMIAPQKWIAVAQFQRPDITNVKGYYRNIKQLAQLTESGDTPAITDTSDNDDPQTVVDPIYQQFLQRLSSVDNRRAFWQQINASDNPSSVTPALLEREIASLQFIAGDKLHGTVDTLKLQASSAEASSRLLHRYVEYTNQQVLAQTTEDIALEWQTEIAKLQQQIAFQQKMAKAVYDQQWHKLSIAAQPQASQSAKNALLMLEQQGPEITHRQLEDEARLATLQSGPMEMTPFYSWSYLQTPYPPATRASPRLLLLCFMWGMVGLIIGAGIAIVRRQ